MDDGAAPGGEDVVVRWGEALDTGLSNHRLRRLIETGALTRVARGVYTTHRDFAPAEPHELLRQEHLRRAREQAVVHPGHLVSHQSAAAVHGLDLQLHPAMDLHLTSVERADRSRRGAGNQFHHADSIENDWVVVDGLRVTTISRTISDVLRTSSMPHSVAMLDGAVRSGRVSAIEVARTLGGQKKWRGRPRARGAFDLHDPRRETWLESFSFVTISERGAPMPLPQVDVLDEGFHFVARVDGVIGATFLEADGADKYLIRARELGIPVADSIAQTKAAQQIRHDRLLALGMTGVRWTPTEIHRDADGVTRRVIEAVEAARSHAFRGYLRLEGRIFRP